MDKRQKLLLEVAEELADEGFQLAPIGTNKSLMLKAGLYRTMTPSDLTQRTLSLLRKNTATGIRIELGVRGAIPQDDGTVLVPLAIEREGHASRAFRDRFIDALARLGVMDRTWKKLSDDDGFVQDTGGGGRRWFFLIHLDSIDELPAALAQVESHRAVEKTFEEDGSPVWVLDENKNPTDVQAMHTAAEILTQHAIAAPSYGDVHKTGTPYSFITDCLPAQMPILSVDELALLGAVLAESTDGTPVQDGNSTVVKLPGRLSQLSRDVMRLYNLTASDEMAADLLLDHGWTLHSGEPGMTDEVFFVRPGAKTGGVDAKTGGGERPGGVYVYTTSDAILAAGYHHPFALYARLLHEGDADAAARKLVEDGTVALPVSAGGAVLRATEIVEIELHNVASVDAQQMLVDALGAAENPRDSETPLVLLKTGGTGAAQAILTPIPGAAPTRWTKPQDLGALLLSVAQPCAKKYDKEGALIGISYQHKLPERVVDGVYKHLMGSPGALPTVQVVASEPVLIRTRSGLTIESASGYHASTKVLLTIPHADRDFWAEGYRVAPEPTRAQAQAAADYLLTEMFSDFPFASEGDRARALTYLLTLCGRTAVPTVPAWLLDAADRGTGKTKLGDICRIVANGSAETIAVFPAASSDEENRKAVVGAVQQGKSNLYIDEVPRGAEITSKVLTEVVTAQPGMTSYRALGGNHMVPIEGLTLTYAGNNVAVGGDFNRRTFPIRMEWLGNVAAHERAVFRHGDLIGFVRDHRPTLLAAAHTIILHGAQNPLSVKPVGSFEQWSALILGALAHIDMDGTTAYDRVIEGRSEWTAANDALSDDWGDFYAWFADSVHSPIEIKALRAKLAATRDAQIDVQLPPDIFKNPGETDMVVNRRWARAFVDMKRTKVVHGGSIYWMEIEDRGKKATRYSVKVLRHASAETTGDDHNSARVQVDTASFLPDAPVNRSTEISVAGGSSDLEF